jgi:hypothetical protein
MPAQPAMESAKLRESGFVVFVDFAAGREVAA